MSWGYISIALSVVMMALGAGMVVAGMFIIRTAVQTIEELEEDVDIIKHEMFYLSDVVDQLIQSKEEELMDERKIRIQTRYCDVVERKL